MKFSIKDFSNKGGQIRRVFSAVEPVAKWSIIFLGVIYFCKKLTFRYLTGSWMRFSTLLFNFFKESISCSKQFLYETWLWILVEVEIGWWTFSNFASLFPTKVASVLCFVSVWNRMLIFLISVCFAFFYRAASVNSVQAIVALFLTF